MTALETQKAFALVQSMYPDANRSLSDDALQIVLKEWERQFAGFEAATVFAAIEHLIATRQGAFAPNIAEIKEAVRHLGNAEESTFAEEWPTVLQAIQNSTYNSRESYARLSPQMQKALGSPARLRELAGLDDSSIEYARHDLGKSFAFVRQREADHQKTPASVRAYIGQASKPTETASPLPPAKAAAHAEAAKAVIKRYVPKRNVDCGEITEEKKRNAIDMLREFEKQSTKG